MKQGENKQLFIMITVIMVIAYISIGIYGVSNANRLNSLYEASYKNSISVGSFTVDLYGSFLGVESSLKEAMGAQNEEQIRYALNQINEEGLKIQKKFAEIQTISSDKFDKNSGLLQVILEEFQEYEIAKDETYEMLNNGELIKCKNNISLVLIPKVKAITINLKIFVDAENEDVKASYVEYRNVSQYIRIQIWVGIGLLLVFALYASVYIIRSRKFFREKDFLEKEEFRITIDTINEGVMVMNQDLKIVKINKVAEDLTGWSIEGVKDKHLNEVFLILDELSLKSMEKEIKALIESDSDRSESLSGILHSKSGDEQIVSFNHSCIKDIYGNITAHIVIFRDITERRMKEKKIYFMTYHDQVTQLYNRTYYEEQKAKLGNESNYPLSVIQGDINGLKLINDAFGHAKGDDLLKDAANILRNNCRESDIISRTGGDEFTIFLPNTTNDEANNLVSKIEAEIQKMEGIAGEDTFIVSIALGAATMDEDHEDISEVVKRADEYMYKKKLLEKDSLHNSLLRSIKTTLEEKSHETEAHASRLVNLSKVLGEELHLAKDKLYELELLSNLHDIGKIAIPNRILNKKGPLSDEEWIEMKKHPEIGYRIAQSTAELGGIAKYILCHHERWDGNGYPQGLAKENIPLMSRIISVVDAYDAMTDDRIYRKGMPKKAALDEIERNAGTQFDPDIAILFIDIMNNNQSL